MKYFKVASLVIFVSLALVSMYGILNIIIKAKLPESSIINTKIIKPENIVNSSLTAEKVTITIGSEVTNIIDPAFILIEDKAGKITIISSSQLKEAPHKDTESEINVSRNTEGTNSLPDLLLQTITASGNAHAYWRCTGPYVNSNGEVVPRKCEWI